MTRLPPRLLLSPEDRDRLMSSARGEAAADLALVGGQVLNVYTEEVSPASVGITAGRIAWVLPAGAEGPAHERLDIEGLVLTPGLIEPHCHPDILYTPGLLAATIPAYGTTAVVADTGPSSLLLDDGEFHAVVEGMAQASVKFFWDIRSGVDGVLPLECERLDLGTLSRLLEQTPGVYSSGELTSWPRWLAGDERLRGFVERVVAAGHRVNGHAAGASARTLTALGAGGITSDHEAMTPDEILTRLRLGYWVMLRHSSLRPDGHELAAGLAAGGVPTDRVMLTTDGPVPADLLEGYLDAVVRIVTDAGIHPARAVRMASLHPAVYLGLDAHLGGVAPGRCADLVAVERLDDYRPQMVLCDGVVVEPGKADTGRVDWSRLERAPRLAEGLSAQRLADVCAAGPLLRSEGIVTRLLEEHGGDGRCLAALVSRHGDWVVGARFSDVSTEALASTFTMSGDVFLLGADADALVRVYREAIGLGGGMVTPSHAVSLPVLGRMYAGDLASLVAELGKVERTVGLPQDPPLPYVSFFLTGAVLPDVRLTPLGTLDVKTQRTIAPPEPLGKGTA